MLTYISRDRDVSEALFEILEINQMVSNKIPLHLLPSQQQLNLLLPDKQ